MALYEKRERMPPYLAEIPYGFKNLWRISVSEYDLQNQSFAAGSIKTIILNGSEVTASQLQQLFDYNRDGCSLTRVGAESGLFVTLTEYDKETLVYGFQTLIEQNLKIDGVLGITGDMVDNTNPQMPVIGHDNKKLDVIQYEAEMSDLTEILIAHNEDIQANANNINGLQENTITSITVNGQSVPKSGGAAQISIAALTPDELAAALASKVDKTVAGAGNKIVQSIIDTFDTDTRTLSFDKTLLSLEDGSTQTIKNKYSLAELLGIDALEAIDKELVYFCPDSVISSIDGINNIPLGDIYRFNDDGTIFNPTTTENIQILLAVTAEYSGFNIISRQYVSWVGYKNSSTSNSVACTFTSLRKFDVYNRYNAYRAGMVIYDPSTNAMYSVLQAVPRPVSEAGVIPVTNSAYYSALIDNSNMAPNTIFANFEDYPNPGQDYTVDQARIELMKGETSDFEGYNEYVGFKTDTIPSGILTNEDWNAHISVWVTDGIVFTTLDKLLSYLSNYAAPERYKLSNRGIIKTRKESGGIQIIPIFDIPYIESRLNSLYIPTVPTAASGNVAVFDSAGKVADGGLSISGMATAAQGVKADSAIQSVALSFGAANGTVKITVDGNDTEVSVTGLNAAAYMPSTAFATAEQGQHADSSVQAVEITSGTDNGTLKLTVAGTQGNTTTDNIPVTGLGSAAFMPTSAFADAEQGNKADSAVQDITLLTGDTNGTVIINVDGKITIVPVAGLGSAAYTSSGSYATTEQGSLADTALQPDDIVDSLTSIDALSPLSANQGRVLLQKIESLNPSGKPIGGFSTYAQIYTNTSQFANDLQPININDTIYIAADENHTGLPAQYKVSYIGFTGDITYSFVRLVPDTARDFIYNPITTEEIAEGAVGGALLANDSVTGNKILNNTIEKSKLSTSLQASIGAADNALQSPITATGTGTVVTNVTQESDNTLTVKYGNALTDVDVSGLGDFITGGSINGSKLTLNKDGTAIQEIHESGQGNVLTGAVKDASGKLLFTKGTAITEVSTDGTGNAVAKITVDGAKIVSHKATLLASINKNGTGNALTGVSTGANGEVILSSDTLLKALSVTGNGNVLTDISASDGTITVTKGSVITSIPISSTSLSGIVQLNDTLTSDSAEQALTAKQGKALKKLIDTNDSLVVHLSDSETITGTKTFSAHPIIPEKTILPASPDATQYATEAQVATRYAKVLGAALNNLLAFGANGNLIDTGIPYDSIDMGVIDSATIQSIVNEVCI